MKTTKFLEKFRRVTSSNEFIPQIDGLRFIAIAAVFLHHFNGKLLKNHEFIGNPKETLFHRLLHHGDFGVPLFFVISGFILAMPFAQFYMGFKKRKIPIKKYFLRRVTRLEPPYFLVILGCYLLYAVVDSNLSFRSELPHVLAALLYVHNFVFNELLTINLVTWSLEIEVQFYILAPLLALVFKLNKLPRRLILIAAMLLFPFLNDVWFSQYRSLYKYIHYFLMGFLLVDLYLNKENIHLKKIISIPLGFAALFFTFYINSRGNMYHAYAHLALIFILYQLILQNNTWQSWFSNPWLTTIGGMCYTIYLIHFPIQGFVMKAMSGINITNYYGINFVVHFIVVATIILTISGIFFLLIEKPCMRKDWYKRKRQSTN